MHTIGILSDTHGLLRDEVLSSLQGCDAILHAGDIDHQGILDRLEEIAPVYAVRGNMDIYRAQHIPPFLDLTLFGIRIYMTHRQADLPTFLSVYDLVVFGHSHRFEHTTQGGTVLVNPGSCGPKRFNLDVTMALLRLSDDGSILDLERIDLLQEKAQTEPSFSEGCGLKRDIMRVMHAVDRGKSVSEIARSCHINEGLTQQICRLYLTHPGVDADGIMDRMGL